MPRGRDQLGRGASRVLQATLFCGCVGVAVADAGGLLVPRISSGELATPEQLHRALLPAWDSLVEERNSAGLVAPKEEGKTQPPLSKQETAFQYARTQRGEVDSARLLLVFGMVPSTSYVDEATLERFMEESKADAGSAEAGDGSESSHLPAVVDVNQRYADGSTPLHMASTFGLVASVRGFLEAGADVSSTATSGVQPIHAAAIMGHVGAVELLAEHRADVNARHKFAASTPLHFAAEMGHPDVVRRLCELGADVTAEKRNGGAPIHVSADTNNAAVARVLLAEPCGSDPEAVLLGDTVPLYLAAGRGFHEVIDVLIEAGANPDRTLWPQRPWQKDKKKKKQKAKGSDEKMTEEVSISVNPAHLLPGSDPSAPGWEVANGATALHNACENGHLQAVLALLDGGARQLAVMEGVTPLIIALQYKHPEIACALLDHKTPANVAVASPRDGQTALHIAAAYDYPEVVARILREGGLADPVDRRRNKPLDYARSQLVMWLLARFSGREPRLDALVRAHRGEPSESILNDAKDVSTEAKELYVKYTRLHSEGTLAEEANDLVSQIRGDDRTLRDAANRRFSVARFLLAGSDAPIAVEAMLKKSKASMHVGLALLGIEVKSLKYKAGKVLEVNGYDLREKVNEAISAALESQKIGDASVFEALVEDLRLLALGRRPKRRDAEDSLGNQEAVEAEDEDMNHLEL